MLSQHHTSYGFRKFRITLQRWNALATHNRFLSLPSASCLLDSEERAPSPIVHREDRDIEPRRPLFINPVRLSRCYLETQLIAPPCAGYPLIAFFAVSIPEIHDVSRFLFILFPIHGY